MSLLRNRPVSTADVAALVRDSVASRREMGPPQDDEAIIAMQGSTDPEVRAFVDGRRWQQLLRRAVDETPFYRRRFATMGLSPDLPLADRAAVPPTTKQQLRGLSEGFVAESARPTYQAWTTGTTGRPTSFWFSTYEIDLAAGLSAMSFMQNLDIGPEDVVQLCVSSRATLGIQNTMRACQMIGAAAFLTGFVDPNETLERLLTPVHLPGKKPRPSVMIVSPSYMALLLAEAQQQQLSPEHFGLEIILCGGEVLSDALRTRVEATFGAPVVDSYGMTEVFPVVGIACSQHHLHHSNELGLVEVLTPDLSREAAPGEAGMLVVTPFPPYRETTLVIRMATGDFVRVLPEQPETCELTALPATSRVLGRATTVGDGRVIHERDVMEVLQGDPRVALPGQYWITPTDHGFVLDVVARADSSTADDLAAAAVERGLPIEQVRIHDDESRLPGRIFYRSLLRETTVTRAPGSRAWSLA